MKYIGLPVLILLAAACASNGQAGPDAGEFQRLIAQARPGSAPQVRDVRCAFIPEEGSEWHCRYKERAISGKWVALETVVAVDRDGWIVIDGVVDPDAPS